MNLKFETERLWLRPFTLEDVADAYQMNLDPEVSRFTGDGGVQSFEVIRKRIQEDVMGDYQKYGYGRLAVIEKRSGKFIGFAGLKYLADRAETDLGFRLIQSYWGRGIATEASRPLLEYGFRELGLERIIALVFPENLASVRVLEKLGFTFGQFIIENGCRIAYYTIKKR